MKNVRLPLLVTYLCIYGIYGCAEYKTHRVISTTMIHSQEEIPEDELIDIGIIVFETEELTEEKAKEEGTHSDIRKAERYFIPYHLKNTLQQSSYWGAVRVIPGQDKRLDVEVKGKIVESNGEQLTLKIDVYDAAGNVWLRKKYKAQASERSYENNVAGQKDAFQDMYNTIANDLAACKKELTLKDIQKIRTISQLRFAEDYAPEAFSGYLTEDEEGIVSINRLPADNDPLLHLILKIRQREHMFIDTLNIHYEGFYLNMWPEYENWRRANFTEMRQLRKMRRKALLQKAGGFALMSVGFVLGMGVLPVAAVFTEPLLFTGSNTIVQGVDLDQQSEIHAAAVEELRQTFGYEMKPVVLDFEGKKYKLTGTAVEQYAQWRHLLRKRYFAETGFAPDATVVDNSEAVVDESDSDDNISDTAPAEGNEEFFFSNTFPEENFTHKNDMK
jgi:hypothetical protein